MTWRERGRWKSWTRQRSSRKLWNKEANSDDPTTKEQHNAFYESIKEREQGGKMQCRCCFFVFQDTNFQGDSLLCVSRLHWRNRERQVTNRREQKLYDTTKVLEISRCFEQNISKVTSDLQHRSHLFLRSVNVQLLIIKKKVTLILVDNVSSPLFYLNNKVIESELSNRCNDI